MNRLRFMPLWLTVGFLLIAFVMVASLMRNPPTVVSFRACDKVYHITAYFCLTFWFCQIYTQKRVRWALGFAFAMLGVGLEFLQGLTDYRTFEYADMAANALGVVCGLIAAQTPLARTLLAVERYIDRFVG